VKGEAYLIMGKGEKIFSKKWIFALAPLRI
jgi:hypothetical protein